MGSTRFLLGFLGYLWVFLGFPGFSLAVLWQLSSCFLWNAGFMHQPVAGVSLSLWPAVSLCAGQFIPVIGPR